MQARHLICASVLLAGIASARAQEYVPQIAPTFEALAPPFEPLAPAPAMPGTGSFAPTVFQSVPDVSPIESTWYTRIDYFHWNERMGGQTFVRENGPLATIGYLRRVGSERFRAEFFDGGVHYSGFAQFSNGTLEPLTSTTNYTGLRGEYDLLYDPVSWPSATLVFGVGTRFWFRDLPDGRSASGVPVAGYLETWWTTYPYFGIQTRRGLTASPIEFYASGRVGATAVTFQHGTWNDAVLYPKMGVTGQLETGFRGPRFFVSAFSEVMTWGQSNVERHMLQPASTLLTIGLRTGITF